MKLIRENTFIITCVMAAIVIVIFVLFANFHGGKESIAASEDAIRDAVAERALLCYVIEDAYPESLDYLEKNYGLAVNQKDYTIIYTPYAENLPPDIRVIYKGK